MIGTNFVSDWLADAAHLTDCTELSAIYSRTAEKGSEFAARHGISEVYTDLEEFFSSGIEAVYIASPNKLHAPQTLLAVSHGLHVLCEKPIASNLCEFDAMRDAALKRGVVLLEAMRPAFDPALEAVRNSLPLIGKVRRASFEFCQYSSRYDKFRAGEVLQAFDPSFSNAAVMDIGVYPIHFCLRLFGEPEKIGSRSVILSNGFEGSGELLLSYDGMTAHVSYAKTFDSTAPSIICGEDGEIKIDKMSCPKKITLRLRGRDETEISFDYKENNMVFELEEFARLIENGCSHSEHLRYSEAEMRVIDEVRRQNGVVFPADK